MIADDKHHQQKNRHNQEDLKLMQKNNWEIGKQEMYSQTENVERINQPNQVHHGKYTSRQIIKDYRTR